VTRQDETQLEEFRNKLGSVLSGGGTYCSLC
jgi:hypothetical protein